MSIFENVYFNTPLIRVNNRDLNIQFYQENLGMRLTYEENAIAIMTGWENRERQFIIEESPSMRTRAVADGVKKLARVRLKTDAASIESLLARGVDATAIFKGKNGYAFEVKSPEDDLFLLHAEDDISCLEVTEEADFTAVEGFEGLADFQFDGFELNVPSQETADFYQELVADGLPLTISFTQREGADLTVEPNVTWDLEIFEFKLDESADMAAIKAYFDAKGLDVYMDKKETILVLSDPSKIEIWFRK
ncbi:CppA N-terminal domain-containing protein [Streptococcus loxodontisalivarius]|uniref:Catechol 2,3-dioxygenase-like lactoylglutathione lyase family enzyme n=1 Tax=Streptococcus loxodontisalivarius TaxID=1349415 RepID=A0ABS2PSI4_9STRE|nr:CppA N-terminal domain-containing protein [Streptococcus loxodontisalivarius]MBM7642510.1 catechol 2,3-dioxygenase-like lactoylglutathione lyase family enzyme [Streptococcus loxodontisalivarius]